MGLGKTLSSLSIICDYLDQLGKISHAGLRVPRSTLIVTPKSSMIRIKPRAVAVVIDQSLTFLAIYEWGKQISL